MGSNALDDIFSSFDNNNNNNNTDNSNSNNNDDTNGISNNNSNNNDNTVMNLNNMQVFMKAISKQQRTDRFASVIEFLRNHPGVVKFTATAAGL